MEDSCDPEKSALSKKLEFVNPESLLPASITASSALKFATEQVQEFLKKEAERYTGSYSAIAVGDTFYKQCSSPGASSKNEIYLDGLTLKRSINNIDEAMRLSLKIKDTIDGTAFQIVPDKILIEQSKAKITAFDITKPFGFDLLAPWTIFKINSIDELSPARPNKVDVTVEVSVTAVWLDAGQQAHSEVIATRKFNFGSIPLGQEQDLEARGFSPQLFPAIPRSVIHLKGLGNPALLGPGNFIISVLVTEYDDYAERVMELEQGVEKNRDSLIERLTSAF